MNSSTSLVLIAQFKTLSEELSAFIEQEGWAVRPHNKDGLPFFLQLSPEDQERVVDLLRRYLEVCRLVYEQGRQLKEGPFFVEAALQYYGYEVSTEARRQILEKPDRVVEFYSPKHTQFFRTLNYFEFTSYTLEDIYCRQWIHLYDRDEAVSLRILEQANYVLSGRVSQPVIINKPHRLHERVSLERLTLRMTRLYLEPLRKNGQIEGLIAIQDCDWG